MSLKSCKLLTLKQKVLKIITDVLIALPESLDEKELTEFVAVRFGVPEKDVEKHVRDVLKEGVKSKYFQMDNGKYELSVQI